MGMSCADLSLSGQIPEVKGAAKLQQEMLPLLPEGPSARSRLCFHRASSQEHNDQCISPVEVTGTRPLQGKSRVSYLGALSLRKVVLSRGGRLDEWKNRVGRPSF